MRAIRGAVVAVLLSAASCGIAAASPVAASSVARAWHLTASSAAELHPLRRPAAQAVAVTFVDATHGWAIAGCATGSSAQCAILGTTDGGAAWRVQAHTRDPIDRIQFVDHTVGFATSDDRCGVPNCRAVVLATTDGGTHWGVRYRGPPAFAQTSFASARDGWAVTPKGTLVRTTDGGATWRGVTVDATARCTLAAVDFPSAADGWVGGSGPKGPCLYRTTDGGRRWGAVLRSAGAPSLRTAVAHWLQGQPTPAAAAQAAAHTADCSASTVHFTAGGAGWVGITCGVWYTGGLLVVHTGDAGRTWRDAWGIVNCLMGCQGDSGGLRPLFFLGGDTAWRLGPVDHSGMACPTVQRTLDGGTIWSKGARACAGDVSYGALAFVNANLGWMATTTGIFHSADGGATWARQWPSPYGGPFDLVAFAAPLVGYAVPRGADNEVLRTADGGRTWRLAKAFDPSTTLSSLSFVGAARGWAWAGYQVPFLRETSDGGTTWARVNLAPAVYEAPGMIAFADARRGWLLTARGALWATGDGGRTWSALRAPAAGVQAAGPLGASAGWAVAVTTSYQTGATTAGHYGLYFTSDGGLRWTLAATYPGAPVQPAVDFVSARTGWDADDGGVLRTTDGGRTWVRYTWPGLSARALGFTDARHGWVLTQTGALWVTADGGAAWTQVQ